MAELTGHAEPHAVIVEVQAAFRDAMLFLQIQADRLEAQLEHSEATLSVLVELSITTDEEIERLKAENEFLRLELRASKAAYRDRPW
jgi:hypothetical protein